MTLVNERMREGEEESGALSFEPQASPSVARNVLLNLGTQTFLLILSVFSFPILLDAVSTDGFGFLSLIWVVVGYVSLLDLGISWAITKFLAEAIAEDSRDKLKRIIWTAMSMVSVGGVLLGIVIFFLRGVIVFQVLGIADRLADDALVSLSLVAVSIPFLLLNGVNKGIQVAHQRFDLVNLFQLTIGTLQWAGSIVLVLMGYGVVEVVALLVVVRIFMTGAALLVLTRMIQDIWINIEFWDRVIARKILGFGGWVTVSRIVSPLFLYLDRIFIGAIISLTAVSYYTIPQEIVVRLLIIPGSLSMVLYPMISAETARSGEGGTRQHLSMQGIKYVALLVIPAIVIFLANARWILSILGGEEFASESYKVLWILAGGLFFNAVAQIPAVTLQAIGRPDINAKFHLAELSFTLIMSPVMIMTAGVVGAALVWTVRVMVDSILLLFAMIRVLSVPVGPWLRSFLSARGMVLGLLILGGLGLSAFDGNASTIAATLAYLLVYCTVLWHFVLGSQDRVLLRQLKGKLSGGTPYDKVTRG